VDPFRSQVSLLLHGNGTNGSTTITDNSPSPKTVTAVGNAQISTAQSKFGGASIAFDGNGDYLNSLASNAFAFETGDFTVEAWVYPQRLTNLYGQPITGTYAYFATGNFDRGWLLNLSATGQPDFYMTGTTSGFERLTGSSAVTVNQWTHIAASRQGTTLRLFAGGTQVAFMTSVTNENYFGDLRVATSSATSLTPSIGNPDVSLQGYIDDLRITKGVARYTANFTPPAAPFPDI
jgi:hypothetical protein